MMAANYVLLALGILGGTDILLYHSVSHGIRSHTESRWELVTHAMRGPTYAALFLIVPNFRTCGFFAVTIAALLVLDVGISIADFAVERRSRAKLGGLPSGEYVLHMMLAILFGAFVALAAPKLVEWAKLPTRLIASGELAAGWVRATLVIFAAGVLSSGLMDAAAAVRLMRRCPA